MEFEDCLGVVVSPGILAALYHVSEITLTSGGSRDRLDIWRRHQTECGFIRAG